MFHLRTPALVIAALALFLVGCGHISRTESSQTVMVGEATPASPAVQEEPYRPLPQYGTVRLDVNKKVLRWINYFQTRGRPHMKRYLQRSTRYLPLMKSVLRKHGLPEELSSLVFVESGFNPKAHSFAAAVGYWQFIAPTGRRYGLLIDQYEDDRMDPVLSTEAAGRYLATLHDMFGDWYLALAAYNTGEGRVKRAVRRFRTKDFWKITSRRRSLPRETRNYVPKFIAVSLIAKNPERYGFTNIEYQPPLAYEKVLLRSSISMDKLAKAMGIDYKKISSLNPRYRSDFIPVKPNRNTYVNVPVGYGEIAEGRVMSAMATAPVRKLTPSYHIYRVRRGDSLSRIAYKFRTRVSTLRRLNNIRRRSFLRVGQRLKVPNRYGRSSYAARTKKAQARKRVAPKRRISSSKKHVVRRGENLTLIARKYGATVRQLKNWNRLGRRHILRPGQKLKVSSKGRIHIVRRGENLSTIARKYRVNISKIAQANALRNKSRIHVGTSLVIPD